MLLLRKFGNLPFLWSARFTWRNYTSEAPSSSSRSTKRNRNKGESATYERVGSTDQDDDVVASEILTAALNHVNATGWNQEAIRAGARDVFMSEEISGIFREYDLVKYFFAASNSDLEKHLSASDPPPKLLEALEYRMEKIVPYGPKFHEALALAAKPENAGESLRLLLTLSDSIAHHSLKDRSTDMNWYTKRLGIASIYVSSELCFVQDKSENYKDTFDFLSRRVKDFEQLGNGALPGGLPMPDLMAAGFTTLNNVMKNNSLRR